jgi:hypothetical protein
VEPKALKARKGAERPAYLGRLIGRDARREEMLQIRG